MFASASILLTLIVIAIVGSRLIEKIVGRGYVCACFSGNLRRPGKRMEEAGTGRGEKRRARGGKKVKRGGGRSRLDQTKRALAQQSEMNMTE